MKNYFYLILCTAVSILVVSCGSTNNLANHNLQGKTIYYDEMISGNAQKVNITYSQQNNNNNQKKSDGETIGKVLETFTTGMLTSDIEQKVQRASDPKAVVQIVSTEVENTLKKYFNVKAAPTIDDNYDFIANITLDQITLNSSPSGLYLTVRAITQITARGTGEIVWENAESESVPMRQSSSSYSTGNKSQLETGLSNVLQATELSMLSEEKIKSAFDQASREVGRLMSETLREDIAEAAQAKK